MGYHEAGDITNATIGKTMLGIEDHGIFTCVLFVDYGDHGTQGFGTHDLRGAWCADYLQKLLNVCGVGDWEDLIGQNIRVKFGHDSAGWGNSIEAIGHITKDIWLEPKKLAKKYFLEKGKKKEKNG